MLKIKMIDLSDEGRKKFYETFFGDVEKLRMIDGSYESKYNIMLNLIEGLKSYENQIQFYKSQLKILWELKKNHFKISSQEREDLNGVISLSSQKRGEAIKKYEDNLQKFSKSFKKDLAEIISKDPSTVSSVNFN